MKVRGNKGDAESPFPASYFLPNKPIAKVIAHKINKNLKIEIKILTFSSLFYIVINFTTATYRLFNISTDYENRYT